MDDDDKCVTMITKLCYTYFVCVFALYILYTVYTVIISRPPENTTVFKGSNVTISCGYSGITTLLVTWIINGSSFTQKVVDRAGANGPAGQVLA